MAKPTAKTTKKKVRNTAMRLVGQQLEVRGLGAQERALLSRLRLLLKKPVKMLLIYMV